MTENQIECSPITERDIYQVTKLLQSMRFHIGGARANYVQLRQLCEDAVSGNGDMFMSVARGNQNKILGVVLGAKNYHSYWQKFYLKNALFVPRVIVSQLYRKFWKSARKKKFHDLNQTELEKEIEFRNQSVWQEQGEDIVHIVLIIIDSRHRHKKIGRTLYNAFTKDLKKAGIRKVIARIGYRNTGSIILHQKSGWTVYGVTDHVEATLDLKSE